MYTLIFIIYLVTPISSTPLTFEQPNLPTFGTHEACMATGKTAIDQWIRVEPNTWKIAACVIVPKIVS